MVSFLHLTKSRPDHQLSGLINLYGCFDVSKLPQAYHFQDELILNEEIFDNYIKATCPAWDPRKLKDPYVSPLYANLQGLKLPTSLFFVGTADMLLDDTVFMSAKYQIAGGETVTKIYPGAPHGFYSFPHEHMPFAKDAEERIIKLLKEKAR
jgi:acetyl esterase/lipase